MLGVYENWLRTHNLVPTYPWDGSDFSEWDTGDEANVGLGLPLPSSLEPTSLSFANRDALGVALRNRLTTLQTAIDDTRAGDLQEIVRAPYSQRFWGYLKWASLIVRRFDGELVDFHPPLAYDRDGTILSAIPFLDFVNGTHWRWHDFSGNHAQPYSGAVTPIGTITPGWSSPVGQRAAAAATAPATQNVEFLRFHRDHIQMFHNWLARTGQPEVSHINMLSVWTGTFGSPSNRGWPPDAAGNPTTWTPTDNPPWTNDEADTGSQRLRDFATAATLAGNAMGTYHAEGHNSNPDITHPLQNNYHYRFFAWHQFLDHQWFVRAPGFARWNSTTKQRERVFRPVRVTDGAAWPGMNALTIVRDTSAAADSVSPANAVDGISLATGGGTVRMQMRVTVTVAMAVKMHLVAPQAPEHVQPKADQHDADGEFQPAGQVFRNRRLQN
jgi:hypothetical protein